MDRLQELAALASLLAEQTIRIGISEHRAAVESERADKAEATLAAQAENVAPAS